MACCIIKHRDDFTFFLIIAVLFPADIGRQNWVSYYCSSACVFPARTAEVLLTAQREEQMVAWVLLNDKSTMGSLIKLNELSIPDSRLELNKVNQLYYSSSCRQPGRVTVAFHFISERIQQFAFV
jgi:hypothetical protein